MTQREFLDIVFALVPKEANTIMDAFDEYVESAQLSTNLAQLGTDLISRQAAIDICDNVIDLFRGQFGAGVLVAIKENIEELPSAQSEIVRCKNCKHWVPGYITDNDDFIPPKCGEWQQMVGHSSDDYCSLAERREDG